MSDKKDQEEKKELNFIPNVSKDGKVILELGEPEQLTAEEKEKRDKEHNEEMERLINEVTGKGKLNSLILKDYENSAINLINESKQDLIDTVMGRNTLNEMMNENLDSIFRPKYIGLAERFTIQYETAHNSLNLETLDSLLNQTSPLNGLQNTLNHHIDENEISELASNALVDFSYLLDEAFPNQSVELERALGDLYLEKHLTDILGLYELKHYIDFEEIENNELKDNSKHKLIDLKDSESYKDLLGILSIKHGINKPPDKLTEQDKEFIFSQEKRYASLKENKKKRGAYLHYIFIGRAIISFLDRQRLNIKIKEFKKPTPTDIFNEIKCHHTEFDHDNIIEEPHYITDHSFEWITRKGVGKPCNISSTLLTRVFKRFNPNRAKYTALNQKDINNIKNNLQ